MLDSYTRERLAHDALERLAAVAEKRPALALSVQHLSTPGIIWHGNEKDLRPLLLDVIAQLASAVLKIDESGLDLMPEVEPPLQQNEAPLGEWDGKPSFNEEVVNAARQRPMPLAPSTRLSRMLGRGLTAAEWARIEPVDEAFRAERRAGVQEMPKVEQPAEKKPEPAPGVLERWGIKSRPDKG
jgi:hypothetical protein